MPEFVFLIVVLPIISAIAYLMDNDGQQHPGSVLMRILRWDIAFVALIMLEYHLLFS